MTMGKSKIEDCAVSGLPLDGHDVARVGRNGRVVTLRHVWPDNTDARVWDGVRRAAHRLAQETVNRTGRRIDLMSAHGDTLDQFSPEAEAATLGGE